MIYIVSGLTVFIIMFLVGIIVQLIRMEKRITELSYYAESKLSIVLNEADKKAKSKKE